MGTPEEPTWVVSKKLPSSYYYFLCSSDKKILDLLLGLLIP